MFAAFALFAANQLSLSAIKQQFLRVLCASVAFAFMKVCLFTVPYHADHKSPVITKIRSAEAILRQVRRNWLILYVFTVGQVADITHYRH
jgi:hypothetical protein